MPEQDRETLVAKLRSIAAEAYNEADGDVFVARKLLRAKRKQYGFDFATAMLLLQLAIALYSWAKEHGYLTQISVVAYPDEPTLLESFDVDVDEDDNE